MKFIPRPLNQLERKIWRHYQRVKRPGTLSIPPKMRKRDEIKFHGYANFKYDANVDDKLALTKEMYIGENGVR